jgi:hypothetical protein
MLPTPRRPVTLRAPRNATPFPHTPLRLNPPRPRPASYFTNMSGIATSRIVRGLLPPLVCVLITSYSVCTYEELWNEGRLDAPFAWPDLAVSPDGPFSISTFALSLLLVFRTNSSYDRWCADVAGLWGSQAANAGSSGGAAHSQSCARGASVMLVCPGGLGPRRTLPPRCLDPRGTDPLPPPTRDPPL